MVKNRLTKIRESRGLSKRAASELLGIDIKTLTRYEQTPELEGTEKYLALCNALERSNKTYHYPMPATASDSFKEIIQKGYYYIDKTMMIRDILSSGDKIMLFTRPRRFGKTINMDMVKSFFDINEDKNLFQGLAISKEAEIVEKFQNKHPVIFLSLKDCFGASFQDFLYQFSVAIKEYLSSCGVLLDSPLLDEEDKATLRYYKGDVQDANRLSTALSFLTYALAKHYQSQVVVIIDEYDVPLEKASFRGYYDELVDFFRIAFSKISKTNEHIFKVLYTGCLRISKESIFTGLNNPSVYSVLDYRYARYFGFLEEEVERMLQDFHMLHKMKEIKKYYDGYRFGPCEIYCPYDVTNYVSEHLDNIHAKAKYYWINSSGNDVIRKLLEVSDLQTRSEIETLIEGKSIVKKIDLNITYRDIYKNKDNIYTIMVAAGYLTVDKALDNDNVEIRIPNLEAREAFIKQIKAWIDEVVITKRKNPHLIDLFLQGKDDEITAFLNQFLMFVIGIHDYSRSHKDKEAFYHGLLLGLLSSINEDESYLIQSNKEAGEGFFDLAINDYQNRTGVIIEIKYAEDGDLERGIQEGLSQIDEKQYERFFQKGYEIHKCVVAFHKKRCIVESE